MIHIVAIGKKHEDWVAGGIERYQKRLRAPYDVQWHLLPHSSLADSQARQEESTRILSRIDQNQYVVLLDETGTLHDSPGVAALLEQQFNAGQSIIVIIGGAYGVDERVHSRANATLSLSKLVFPHQLVRLMCIEQLYRAQEISRGGRYHHV